MGDAVAFLSAEGEEAAGRLQLRLAVATRASSRRRARRWCVAFVFAIVVISLVLAAQYESLRDPLIIPVSVPMSICGALVPLALGFATINIYTQIGLVTLIGLISQARHPDGGVRQRDPDARRATEPPRLDRGGRRASACGRS